MSILFFDTETTGLPDFNKDLTDPAQPYVVQFAMLLADDAGKEVAAFKTVIQPEGWKIDETGKAFETHGLSQAYLEQYGLSMKTALLMFRMFSQKATLKVAHNYRFDGFILKGLHERLGMEPAPEIDKFCTMKAMTSVMNIPPTEKMVKAGFNKPKSPRLEEAYEHCTGKKLEGAHDALADVRATKEVFFWIRENGHFKDQPRSKPQEAA